MFYPRVAFTTHVRCKLSGVPSKVKPTPDSFFADVPNLNPKKAAEIAHDRENWKSGKVLDSHCVARRYMGKKITILYCTPRLLPL